MFGFLDSIWLVSIVKTGQWLTLNQIQPGNGRFPTTVNQEEIT